MRVTTLVVLAAAWFIFGMGAVLDWGWIFDAALRHVLGIALGIIAAVLIYRDQVRIQKKTRN